MNVYLRSAVRTPVGKFLGGLADRTAPQLGSVAVAEAVRRAGVEPGRVDEVIFGHVVQAGCGQNPARQAAVVAGLPVSVPATTINKVCGSGLKAVMLAAQAIRAGDATVVVAGGMESMSNAPFLLPKARAGFKYGDQTAVDALIRDGLWCPFEDWPMGAAAEHVAAGCGVSRADQDAFAAESHRRAAAAWDRGDFAAEVVPDLLPRDEGIRPATTAETLAKLKPAFPAHGQTVTAGNASQLSDGAAAVVVSSDPGPAPLAKIMAYHTAAVAPKELFLAPVPAIHGAVAKAGLTLADIDLFELNEAFAAQAVACVRKLELDPDRVNVNGGAVALGHPIGASGARVLVTLVHALRKRGGRVGVASLCLGGGEAVAVVIETV